MKKLSLEIRKRIYYLIPIIFISWGITWMIISNSFIGILFGSFFIIVGVFISLRIVLDSRKRKKGILEVKVDERSLQNSLRASKKSYEFIIISLSIVILLHLINIVDDSIFISATVLILCFTMLIHLILFYYYERKGYEDSY